MSIAPSGTKRLRVDADALQPEEGERDDASDPSRDSNPPSKKRFVRIHDKGGNRFFFYSCTEETELQLRSNYPGKYQFDDDDPLGAADPRKFPGVRDAVESIKPSFGGTKGGLVIVDWPLKPSDPRRIVELDPGATDSQQSLTIKGTSFWKRSPLCSRCENVVATSKVINRPWRKVNGIDTGSRDNPVTKYDETYLKYKGPKVDKYSHHETLGALRESAHAGCHLCSLFFAVDPTAPVPYDERFNEVPYFLKAIFAKDHSQGPGVLVIFPENLPSKATYMMFEEPRGHVAATLKSPCTNDEKVMDTARTWLQTCIEKHEACRIRANTSTGFIPTRLLEVNDTGSSVRLVLRSNLPSKEQYITLSHCWGKAKIIRLLESTLERFQKAIPFKRLPRNFQDAVKTTAMLGYRYIWIDSLCIIQDSSEDWKAEAAKMGAVYRHSVCTLAALGSSSSQGGCFKYRSHLSITPCQLIEKSDEHPGVYAENWSRKYEPLHTRAWVVQERTLAIRTLNFGISTISWDCISSKASEEEPEMQEVYYTDSLKRTFWHLLGNQFEDCTSHHPDWINAWWKLVGEYSSCDLTHATDRWPAISGLAAEVENDRGQKLVHGLWSHNLVDEMLWTVSRAKEERLSISMPSWTWLGIDGKVLRRRYDYLNKFKVDAIAEASNATCDEPTNDLKVTGRMLRMKWAVQSEGKDTTHSYNFRLIDLVENRAASGLPLWDGSWIPDTVPSQDKDTWVLQLVKSDEHDWKQCAGIVVVPVAGKKDTWERVGFYEFGWREVEGQTPPKRWLGVRTSLTVA